MAKGQPLESEVTDRAAPGSQALSGLAATNAVGQILPDKASELMMEKLPGINMSVGTHGAGVAEAAADRSRQDKPRDPVLNSLNEADKVIDKGVSAVLPKSVNQTLDKVTAVGEMKIGELIETGSGSPSSSGDTTRKALRDHGSKSPPIRDR